ncbi:helix-turn-helix transcriptional regulator [Rothia kristinae]|uniref:Helix-turn-helix domain-containing protein n=1 Tax=Rothia kristinae TaxID=37923 RepID=A0A7T3F804_9MICC|nr:crosslink repair DNA glycosylase YcaQ family protein [Rothia kristinae]QPT53473.1 helix-turn-helix domain-containing protein [Rothia kristinae]
MYSVKQKQSAPRAAGAGEPEERTRDRVLQGVLAHGPVSAADLAGALGLTPAAIRRHLEALEKDQLVEVTLVRKPGAGAGRPARRYVVAPQGHAQLGNDYLDIALDSLRTLRAALGEGALERFAQSRFEEMERRYRPVVEAAGPDIGARARALGDAMTRDGFVASTSTMAMSEAAKAVELPEHLLSSVQLCQGHCPVRDLAEEFPEFCDEETRMIASLLGVDVRRLSTMAGGAHVCTTHIPLARGAQASVSGRNVRPTKEGSHD